MSPKERAVELVKRFTVHMYQTLDASCTVKNIDNSAKKCALISVDEIIDACEYNHADSWNTKWWNKVKEEINKL